MTDEEIWDLCSPFLIQEKYTWGQISEMTGLEHIGREIVDACTRMWDRSHAELEELLNESNAS